MQDLPETPEGAALFLLTLILRGRNDPVGREVLDLYAECLRVARGQDELSRDLLH